MDMTKLPRGIEADCKAEIVGLHQFFQDWFNGNASVGDFERFSGVLAPDFTMISPDGKLTRVRPLIEALGAAGGSGPGMRIWIENSEVLIRDGASTLAVYEECQDQDGRRNRRRSTVLFRDNAEKPNGLEWVHVHETWMDS